MALEARLETKLSQRLVLTPQLQQAIKLLQLPQIELTQTINQEMMENPFLDDAVEEYHDEGLDFSAPPDGADGATQREDFDVPADDAHLASFSVDEYFEERGADGRDLGYYNPGTVEKPDFETFLTSTPDLIDHLMWQLGFTGASPEIAVAAEMIIGNIDESGYLQATDEELMEAAKCDARTLRRALELVRGFDPPGVGARDIKECLALQIKALGLAGTLVESIVRESFGELEKKRIPVIAKLHGVSVEEAAAAVRIIEGLEPRPGRIYSNSVTSYVAPDVYLEKVNDIWKIILNDENIPHVRISAKYKDLLGNKKSFEKDERQFLIDKYRSAVWLLKSLDERNKTIYRVTDSILRHQAEFFDHGVQSLKPLNLRNISEDIGMHESNISRVTSNKYLSCPHGIFPFKYFFSSSLSGADGDISSTTVKDTIRKLVEEENSQKPLTDQKIVEILRGRNITIARRTMAKYREELKIPPHTKRRKIVHETN